MKVLLAVDGSKHTKKMLAYLEAHGQLLGGSPEYIVATVEAGASACFPIRRQGNRRQVLP